MTFEMTFEEAVEKYVGALLTGDLMTADEESANVESVVQAWVLLKHTQDRIDSRLKALRKVLLSRAEEFGKGTEKGGSKLSIRGTLVLREKRQAAMPEEKGLRALLEEHGVKSSDAFSKVTKVVMDASKVQNLVDLGKLPEAKITDLKKVTWALRVKESFELAESLDQIVGEASEEMVEKAPRTKRAEADGNRKEG